MSGAGVTENKPEPCSANLCALDFFKNKAKVLLTDADILSNIEKTSTLNGGSEMNKQEFFDRVNDGANFNLLEEDWEDIQIVYNWHPCISDVDGKDQIAALYKTGGLGLIHDMVPTAQKLADNEGLVQGAMVRIEELGKEYEAAKKRLLGKYVADCKSQKTLIEKCQEEDRLITERYTS